MTVLTRFALWGIGLYRGAGGGRSLWVECNFTPTCSVYARDAIERHGVMRGVGFALARIKRCRHRQQLGTIADPVPDRLEQRAKHEIE